ncbi:oxidoreductase UcpA-like [Zerene cesonia]|uniref:oxidoreductase UcpA-like n=1 Tax=Zerene cesonia TaxID=33412 RepID=UPI0018E53207|nr:oxidoreductase UcpA-like [Zerene cesonia]
MSFTNKVVLVIGGSSGIGAATAKQFCKQGADVAIVGRNEKKLQKVDEECKKLGKSPLIINADISKDSGAFAAVDETVKKFGKIDILINNAGILRFGCILDGNLMKSYDEVINVNLRGIMNVTSLAAPHIIKTKGNIIMISSISGSETPKIPIITAYAVSKAGLNQFTKATAVELAPHGVRVNSLSPGPVYTDILEIANVPADILSNLTNIKTALNRISNPDEIAEMILYISSDKCVGVTGSNFVCDNGTTLM